MENPQSLDHHPWDCALDPVAVPLFLTLQWAQGQSLARMAPLLAQHGLSQAELDVLATLRNAVPDGGAGVAAARFELTPSRIQSRMLITSGGLTKVLAQLEQRGLVSRSRQEGDLRVKPVCLTTAGQTVIEAAMKDLVEATGAWLRGALAPEELGQLQSLLARLAGAVTGEVALETEGRPLK